MRKPCLTQVPLYQWLHWKNHSALWDPVYSNANEKFSGFLPRNTYLHEEFLNQTLSKKCLNDHLLYLSGKILNRRGKNIEFLSHCKQIQTCIHFTELTSFMKIIQVVTFKSDKVIFRIDAVYEKWSRFNVIPQN